MVFTIFYFLPGILPQAASQSLPLRVQVGRRNKPRAHVPNQLLLPSLRVIYGLSEVWVPATGRTESVFVLRSENNPEIDVGAGREEGLLGSCCPEAPLPGIGLRVGKTRMGFPREDPDSELSGNCELGPLENGYHSFSKETQLS